MQFCHVLGVFMAFFPIAMLKSCEKVQNEPEISSQTQIPPKFFKDKSERQIIIMVTQKLDIDCTNHKSYFCHVETFYFYTSA